MIPKRNDTGYFTDENGISRVEFRTVAGSMSSATGPSVFDAMIDAFNAKSDEIELVTLANETDETPGRRRLAVAADFADEFEETWAQTREEAIKTVAAARDLT